MHAFPVPPRLRLALWLACLWCCLALGRAASAETLDLDGLAVQPPEGWNAQIVKKPEQPLHATCHPPGDRDAALLVFRYARVEDGAAARAKLADFHAEALKIMSGAVPTPDNVQTLHSEHGEFYLSTYTDPKLVGKPVVRADYKYTLHVTGLVDGHFIVGCDILVQEKQGLDVDEGRAAVMRLKAK